MRLIDKRELMEMLDDMFSRYDGTPSVMEGFKYGLDAVISEVSVMPTIEAEPIRHGKWIMLYKTHNVDEDNDYNWICSECGYGDCHNINNEVPYCWHCGARMENE